MSARSQPTPFFLVVLFVPAPSLSCSAHSVKFVWAYDSNPRAFRVSSLTSLHLSLCDLDFILLFAFVSAPLSFQTFHSRNLLRQKCYKGGWFVTIASVFSQLAGSDRAFVWWPNIFFVESLCPITLISYCNCLTCMACNRCALFRPLPLKQKNRRWQLLNY